MGQTCMPLTSFCQMAITLTAVGGVTPTQLVASSAPSCHVPLLLQATWMLHHHLLALTTGGGGNTLDLQPFVNTIAAGQQQRQHKQAQARAKRQQKDSTTVESWLGPKTF